MSDETKNLLHDFKFMLKTVKRKPAKAEAALKGWPIDHMHDMCGVCLSILAASKSRKEAKKRIKALLKENIAALKEETRRPVVTTK